MRIFLAKIENRESPGSDIFVGDSQGKGWLFQDGAEVEVPEDVLENIKNTLTQKWDEKVKVQKPFQRYTATVIREVVKEDKKKKDDK